MQILQASGEIAGARGELWRVERREQYGRRDALVHLTRPGERDALEMVAVRPAEALALAGADTTLQPVCVRDALRAVAHARRLEHGTFGVRAAEQLNGDVHAWQLAAALAFARGHSRVLLADPVGAGKTVSAAIALSTCLSGGHERRALVIAPGHLIAQWRAELALRVGIDARLADAAALRQAVRGLPAGADPWARPGCTIASIDFLKQPHIARSLEPITWDLLVVDEAHVACGLSERHAACDFVARRARRVLLLTATPSDGGVDRFRALTSLGSAGEPLVTLRHTGGRILAGRARTVSIAAPAPLAELHRAVGDYVSWIASAPRGGAPAVALLAALLVKRALSSPHALRISLSRRLALLDAQPVASQPSLFDVEDDPGVLGAGSGRPANRERRRLASLIDLGARAAREDRRLDALARLLRRTREPAVIFSCFRDTADHLFGRLAPEHSARLLHGQLPPAVADAAIAAFTEGSARLLVATDVAAQGLNLHQRCRWVIHYDLPWRPSTVCQRDGRVDRIGQRHRPHATMLMDATDLSRQMKERMAALTVLMRADERDSAARWKVVAAREASRVLARRHCSRDTPAPLPTGTTSIVEIDLVDEAGASIERAVVAVHGERAAAMTVSARAAARRAAAIRRGLAARTRRRVARERAVSFATLETIATALVQGGLFDRRAIRQRAADTERRADVSRALAAAIAHLTRAGRIQAVRLREIAAFTKRREA